MATENDVIEQSDEDFLNSFDENAPLDYYNGDEEEENSEEEKNSTETDNGDTDEAQASGSEENDDSEVEAEATEASDAEGSDAQGEASTENDENNVEGQQAEGDDTEDVSDSTAVSTEDQLNAIYSPFKANGVKISVKSPEEAIRLMQQGAGAAKRMQELAPKLQIVQMLEKAELLDPSKLNNLIALSNKDPKAIANLIKEAELDPIDIDLDEADNYQPEDHSVSPQEFAMTTVIESLKNEPMFNETLAFADNYDEQSQKAIMENPEILTHLNGHIQSGIYDQIATVVKQEELKGNIPPNTSFLEAYRYYGDQLSKQGAFDQGDNAEQGGQTTKGTGSPTRKSGNDNRNQKRKAAGSTQSTAKPNTGKLDTSDTDKIVELSDEEFMKKYGVEIEA